MFRFYKDFVEKLYLAMIYMRDAIGDEGVMGQIHNNAAERWRRMDGASRYQNPDGVQLVQHIIGHNDMEGSVSDLIRGLQEPLIHALKNEGGLRPNDKDLIDTIVRTVQLPFCRNKFSGDTLDKLRMALLLPDESAGLVEKLRREEMSCGRCGHRFLNQEMGTILIERKHPVLYCTNCAHPGMMACPEGKHSIAAPKNLAKMLQGEFKKQPCEECAVEAKGINVPPDDIGAAQPVVDDPGARYIGIDRAAFAAIPGVRRTTAGAYPPGHNPAPARPRIVHIDNVPPPNWAGDEDAPRRTPDPPQGAQDGGIQWHAINPRTMGVIDGIAGGVETAAVTNDGINNWMGRMFTQQNTTVAGIPPVIDFANPFAVNAETQPVYELDPRNDEVLHIIEETYDHDDDEYYEEEDLD